MTNAMWKLKGQVDLDRMTALQSDIHPETGESGGSRINQAGIDITWRGEHIQYACRDGLFALVLGRPRPSNGKGRLSAMAWLDQYRRNNIESIADIGGSFALVMIDSKSAQVWLVVDRFAAESLCYRIEGKKIFFSERACDVPGPPKTIDPQSIYNYLYFHMIPAPRTIFKEVIRVDAGNALRCGNAGAAQIQWWRPSFVENDFSELSGRMNQFVALVRDSVVEEADDQKTACFLSGGTDSSTVAGMLARNGRTDVQSYSIGFEAEGYDEMEYARIAARHFGLRHVEYYVTPQNLVDSIPLVARAFDQPFGNSSVLPSYYCALRAKDDGFTRMLAGDGGDELFGGNSRYATQQLFEFYQQVPRPIRETVLEPVARNWPIFRTIPGLRQIGGYVRHSSVPMPDRMETFNLLHRIGDNALLQPGFLEQVELSAPLHQQRSTYQSSNAGTLLNRMLAYDWKYTLADSDLPKVRGATQLAGIGVGYPLLSRQLTDFSLQLPSQWKLRHAKLRWFFKKSLSNFLPKEILTKKKHGFGLPFGPWTLREPKLHALALSALERIAERGIVNKDMVNRLFSEHLREAPGYYGEIIWILLMLEHWLDEHAPAYSLGK
jgi:asparagine synthase (glutamine-hydrolysing)